MLIPHSLRYQNVVLIAGLRNLIMVLFAATTIRLMIENYLKYGIRLNPKKWVLAVLTPEGRPSTFAWCQVLHSQQMLTVE